MPATRVRPYSQGGPSTITINSLGVSGVTEGAAFTGNPLATFNDSDGNTLTSAYTVNVDWGDGNRATLPTSDITSTGGGNFKVTAGHTYAEEGAYTLSLSVTDIDGKSANQSTTESVADAALTNLAVSAINASTGLQFSGEVATFNDADPGGQASDYSASINWGDGTSASSGTVTGVGTFVVSGSHTYTAIGTYTVSVTVTDHFASASGSTNGTVKGINPTFQSFAPTEGQNPASPWTVATFTDNDGATSFGATVDWGDGSQATTGTVSGSGGSYTVQASHDYAEESSPTVTVTITDNLGATASTSGSITVADAALSATALDFQGSNGTPVTDMVATFTDADPGGTATDYSTTINWGDGTASSSGTIAWTGSLFTVTGTHTYTAIGVYNVGVTIQDHNAQASATGQATILGVTPTVTNFNPVEGIAPASPWTVATFTDTDGNQNPNSYTANITWGDGSSTNGATVVWNSAGYFAVQASHVYAEEGNEAVSVTISDSADGATASASGTITVADAPLSAAGVAVTAHAGVSWTGTVATFSDSGGSTAVADFTAMIQWGDGSSSTGTIGGGLGSNFTVSGTHTYAALGSDNIVVTITDDGGAQATATSTATVYGIVPTFKPFNGTEGAAPASPWTVATFIDTDGDTNAADFSATVTWGDGQTSAASAITYGNGVFSVQAGHAYAEEGNFTASVAITDSADGTSATTSGTATISDAALSGSGVAIAPRAGSSWTGVVANFSDADPAGTATDYSATIAWGDGTTSSGSISYSGGSGSVTGTHTYPVAGPYTLTITVRDTGGASVTVTSSATFGTGLWVVANNAFLSEGVASATVFVATFSDGDGNTSASAYSATIHWGDGSSSGGTIGGSGGSAGFTVQGSHAYAEEGVYPLSVTVTDTDGAQGTGTATAYVADAALQLMSGSAALSATAGQSATFGLAQFTDSDTAGVASDYTALVDWGDGTTDPAQVTFLNHIGGGNGQSLFNVTGTHTYAAGGNYAVTVVIDDALTGIVAFDTATVSGGVLNVQPATPSFTEGAAAANQVVATFSDSDGNPNPSAYQAMVTWSDGTSVAGTVQAISDGFEVLAGHSFAEDGRASATVSVSDLDGAVGSAVAHFTVADAALGGSGSPLVATAGTPFSGQVATLTDNDPGSTVGDYTLSIDWGDGSAATDGTADGSNGNFTITGSHEYEQSGSYTITTTVTDDGGASITLTTIATVSPPAGTVTVSDLTTTEGASFSGTVASFTPPSPDPGTWQATIGWGDGGTSTGTMTSNGQGGYTISGSHVYADESTTNPTGPFTLTVTVSDTQPSGSGPYTGSGSATVNDAALSATAAGGLTAWSGVGTTLTLGQLTDAAGSSGSAGDFTVSVSWGDNSAPTAGSATATSTAGLYNLQASHTYTAAGTYTAQVSVTDDGGQTASCSVAITVSTPGGGGNAGVNIQATEGNAFSGVVATFNADPNQAASATIAWGDGSNSNGTITPTGSGSFTVSGSHTYADEISTTATVTVYTSGSQVLVSGTGPAAVADAPLAGSGLQLHSVVGQPIGPLSSGAVIATFTDANPNSSAADFTATIDWGDGSPVTAGQVQVAGGGYDVVGNHVYLTGGRIYHITTTLSDAGGQAASALSSASDATVEGHLYTLGLLVAAPQSGQPGSNDTATIFWGDGDSSPGGVMPAGNGQVAVSGSHTYHEEDSYTIHVIVQGPGGDTTSGDQDIDCADAALDGSGGGFHGETGNVYNNVVLGTFMDDNFYGEAADFSVQSPWGAAVAQSNGGGGAFAVVANGVSFASAKPQGTLFASHLGCRN